MASPPRTLSFTRRVFDFWFDGELSHSLPLDSKYFKLWFGAEQAVDTEIRHRFQDDLNKMSKDSLDSIASDPKGALAGVILFDQFSRNIFRDSPRMFETDELALNLARKSIKMKFDKEIGHPLMRAFFYMPFMHSEDIQTQEEGIRLFQREYDQEPSSSLYKNNLLNSLEYMKLHYGIIEKFGRFPHRNAILGRESTLEELQFLKDGGETFDSRKTKSKE